MNLNASPYIGERTNEELQDWVKALQDECVRLSVSEDLLKRIIGNNITIQDAQERMLDIKDEMLKAREMQLDIMKNALERIQRIPIQRTTLAAFSPN